MQIIDFLLVLLYFDFVIFLNDIITVSYTHLDVYKRQGMDSGKEGGA